MVQQMIDKFNEYKLVTGGSAMPTGDKQNPISVKKVALRELPNETRNIIKAPANPQLSKDNLAVFNSVKAYVGTKRQQPDCPLSPSNAANNAANGHLVYVRRKLDTEPCKINSAANADSAISLEPAKLSNGPTNKAALPREQIHEPMSSSLQAFDPFPVASPTLSAQVPSLPLPLGKPIIGLAAPEPKESIVTTAKPGQDDPQHDTSQSYWKERFLRLQMFLKNCDQSSQDDYINMLRSLSAVGRSKHAVELEKRAIQLLLEEGRELHRMKVLNVLGKALPNDQGSLSISTATPVQIDFLRAEKPGD